MIGLSLTRLIMCNETESQNDTVSEIVTLQSYNKHRHVYVCVCILIHIQTHLFIFLLKII